MNYDLSMQYGRFANLYDRLMRGVDYDSWAGYAASFMRPGSDVLECACGTGQISLRLAKMGFSVTASDISDDMLMVAAENQREAGLAFAKLRFIRMDMRELSCHKKVDHVAACCDGVNYLTSRADVKRFFDSAYAVLKPGGTLLFDVSSRYKLEKILGSNSFVDNGEQVAYMWQNNYDEDTKLIDMELSFFVKQGDRYERFDERHIQRAHSVRELGAWLNEAGFEYEAYSCFTREPVKADDERIQFVARKSK